MKGYQTYSPGIEILKVADHKALTCTVPAAKGVLDEASGRKIVKAGTVLPANDATAEGLLLTNIDVTDGDALGSMIVEGVVYKERLPEDVSAEAEPKLKNILFM